MDNGGPAFPQAVELDKERQIYITTEGMSLRDYFIAHAPQAPWNWYRPVMPPRPKPGLWVSDDGKRFYQTFIAAEKAEGDCCSLENQKDLDAWDAERERQFSIQWPAFWADAMIKERDK